MDWDWLTGAYYYFKKESRPLLKGKLKINMTDNIRDNSHPYRGNVKITGMIHNKGYSDGEGIVELTIYDGSSTHHYEAPTGIVRAGKKVMFDWEADFEYIKKDKMKFLYNIRTTRKTDHP